MCNQLSVKRHIYYIPSLNAAALTKILQLLNVVCIGKSCLLQGAM